MISPEQLSPEQLWLNIRAEAEQAIETESALQSYYQTAILDHRSLAAALAHNLSDQLANLQLDSESLNDLFLEALMADTDSSETVGANIVVQASRDLNAHIERDPACDQFMIPLLHFKGFQALQAYRVAHWFWHQGREALASYIQNRMSEVFAVDIHPAASIGAGIMIDHATGVVIGETTVVEDNVSMLHGVSLGGTGNACGDRHPKIRQGVLIAAGAQILGNIEVGEGAKVGAGSLVLDPVPPHTTVAGVPAVVVGRPSEEKPALEMDQQID